MIRGSVVAVVLVTAAALGGAPWWAGALALGMAAWPHPIGRVIGAAAILGGIPWPLGLGVLLIPPSGKNRLLAGALLFWTAFAALRQVVVHDTLPAAPALFFGALAGAIGATASAWVVGDDEAERVGLGVAGAVLLARVGWMLSAGGAAQLAQAEALHAVPLVYDRLVADPTLAPALVAAAPDRDEAALSMGWKAALAAGWKPQRAEGVAVPVAQALEEAGRGGEALRLLARHPRVGEIDAWRTLLERTQGEPVRWGGAVLGEVLEASLPLAIEMDTDGYRDVLFTMLRPGEIALQGEGTAFQGAPSVRVRLDAGPVQHWLLEGAQALALGPAEVGPHRVQVWFDNDLFGPGGDRQVKLTGLVRR